MKELKNLEKNLFAFPTTKYKEKLFYGDYEKSYIIPI